MAGYGPLRTTEVRRLGRLDIAAIGLQQLTLLPLRRRRLYFDHLLPSEMGTVVPLRVHLPDVAADGTLGV
jgi:hypothetical protein